MQKYISQPSSTEKELHILHAAETTHGGIDTYWEELLPMTNQLVQVVSTNPSTNSLNTPIFTNFRIKQSFLHPEYDKKHQKTPINTSQYTHFTIPNTPRSLRKIWHFFLKLRHILRTQHIDILFLHSSFAGCIGRLTLLTITKPWPKVIYCSHGWSFNMNISYCKKRIFLLIERLLTPLTDAIINVSQSEHNLALTNGLKKEKCHLIHNTISPIIPPLLPIQNFDSAKINFLFIGRPHPAKGADILAKIAFLAAKKVPQFHFHIIGVSNSDITFPHNNSTLYGWLSRNDIPSYINQADAIIIPSRWEACSFTLLEAFRQGKPVFSSDIPTFNHLIYNNKNGQILPIDNPFKCLEIMKNFSKLTLKNLGLNAQNIFKEKYTTTYQHQQLCNLYKSILENSF